MNEKPHYRTVLGTVAGKKRGFTTGTAAAAAAKTAAAMLLTGKCPEWVTITLPSGKSRDAGNARILKIPVAESELHDDRASAGIVKDAGDDEDITGGAVIFAEARFIDRAAPTEEHPSYWDRETSSGLLLRLRGGRGIGTVTRKGLPVPPGKPAINPVPRRMIFQAVEAAVTESMKVQDPGGGGRNAAAALEIELSVPDGEMLAKKTWNPRLGITGGISIIGTSGIVEPKSSEAYTKSIAAVIRAIRKQGHETIIITPGYVGEKFLMEKMMVPESRIATVGDHIGWAVLESRRQGFSCAVIAGHIGKLAKVASGILNTHWSFGDARLETIAAWAAAEGADTALVQAILELKLAEAAVDLLRNNGLEGVFTRLCRQSSRRLTDRIAKEGLDKAMEVRNVVVNLAGEALGSDDPALLKDEAWAALR